MQQDRGGDDYSGGAIDHHPTGQKIQPAYRRASFIIDVEQHKNADAKANEGTGAAGMLQLRDRKFHHANSNAQGRIAKTKGRANDGQNGY